MVGAVVEGDGEVPAWRGCFVAGGVGAEDRSAEGVWGSQQCLGLGEVIGRGDAVPGVCDGCAAVGAGGLAPPVGDLRDARDFGGIDDLFIVELLKPFTEDVLIIRVGSPLTVAEVGTAWPVHFRIPWP